MYNYLDFEKVIVELDSQILKLKNLFLDEQNQNILKKIENLEKNVQKELSKIYKQLTPWQKTQVARHPNRPHFLDYASSLFKDMTLLSGDRKFGEDEAMQAGLARFREIPIVFLGLEKGYDTKTRLRYNFGSARPEGYRKAVRVMDLAKRFNIPVISFIDTAGAYPGISAEERGQAEAIARSTAKMLDLSVPVVSVIIGEGGSGGAIAIAAANYVYMLEHSIYSVISPEGAASILWKDSKYAQDAATNMRITAQDLYDLKIIDGIIDEPIGGAHRDHKLTIDRTGDYILNALNKMKEKNGKVLRKERRDKYLNIGRNL